MNGVIKRVMLVLVLLTPGAEYGAEKEMKKTHGLDKHTYQRLETSINTASHVEQLPIELELLRSQKDCAEKQNQEQRRLSALQAPMIEGRYVSPAAFLAAGIEQPLARMLEQHDQEIVSLKAENERALRRAKRRACIGSCPAFTCVGLTVLLLASAMTFGIPDNKCD